MMTGKHTTDKAEALAYGGQRMSDDTLCPCGDYDDEIEQLQARIDDLVAEIERLQDKLDELSPPDCVYDPNE